MWVYRCTYSCCVSGAERFPAYTHVWRGSVLRNPQHWELPRLPSGKASRPFILKFQKENLKRTIFQECLTSVAWKVLERPPHFYCDAELDRIIVCTYSILFSSLFFLPSILPPYLVCFLLSIVCCGLHSSCRIISFQRLPPLLRVDVLLRKVFTEPLPISWSLHNNGSTPYSTISQKIEVSIVTSPGISNST